MSYLFKNANVLSTENGKFKYLKNAFLGVSDGKIDYIGLQRPSKQYSEEKDMYDKMLIPGLVNTHGHAAMTLLRGIGNDLPLMDWLHIIWPIEDSLKEEDFVNGTNMAILEMLACGTTSYSDMYFRPIATLKCVGESGIKANITRVVMGGDENTDYKTYINRVQSLELFKDYHNAFDGRLKVDFSVHAEYTMSQHIAQNWADEILNIDNARLQIHLSETENEQKECIVRHNMTPAQWFESLGFFNIPCYAAHCVWLTDSDMEILKKHNVTAVHNPSSNLKLGSGFAPVVKMAEMGINISLGTDGAASNNNLNMFEEMHLASIIHNGYLQNPVVMNPDYVLQMATVNGAKAQGRSNTGSLEVGMDADIVAVNLDAPHMVPNVNPQALLCYSAQGSDVTMTMVNGKILYENGEYKTMDKEKIFAEFKKSVNSIVK